MKDNIYPLHRTRPAPLGHRDIPAMVIIVCLVLFALAWVAWASGMGDQ